MKIREMRIDDYDEVIAMFRQSPAIAVREADSRGGTEKYLKRNPGLSFVATVGSRVIGCVMCGHDGRRGYLQHLIVRPENREQGIGEKLCAAAIMGLQKVGISKTHIFVFKTNALAKKYWLKNGWSLREDINMYSLGDPTNEKA